jgi:hypothetical protein
MKTGDLARKHGISEATLFRLLKSKPRQTLPIWI